MNAIAAVPAGATPVAGANAGGNNDEENNDPFYHKIQMVLRLDSQKQNNDFISAIAMTNMLSHAKGLKDNILKKVKEPLLPRWHKSMKDVLETSVNRFI